MCADSVKFFCQGSQNYSNLTQFEDFTVQGEYFRRLIQNSREVSFCFLRKEGFQSSPEHHQALQTEANRAITHFRSTRFFQNLGPETKNAWEQQIIQQALRPQTQAVPFSEKVVSEIHWSSYWQTLKAEAHNPLTYLKAGIGIAAGVLIAFSSSPVVIIGGGALLIGSGFYWLHGLWKTRQIRNELIAEGQRRGEIAPIYLGEAIWAKGAVSTTFAIATAGVSYGGGRLFSTPVLRAELSEPQRLSFSRFPPIANDNAYALGDTPFPSSPGLLPFTFSHPGPIVLGRGYSDGTGALALNAKANPVEVYTPEPVPSPNAATDGVAPLPQPKVLVDSKGDNVTDASLWNKSFFEQIAQGLAHFFPTLAIIMSTKDPEEKDEDKTKEGKEKKEVLFPSPHKQIDLGLEVNIKLLLKISEHAALVDLLGEDDCVNAILKLRESQNESQKGNLLLLIGSFLTLLNSLKHSEQVELLKLIERHGSETLCLFKDLHNNSYILGGGSIGFYASTKWVPWIREVGAEIAFRAATLYSVSPTYFDAATKIKLAFLVRLESLEEYEELKSFASLYEKLEASRLKEMSKLVLDNQADYGSHFQHELILIALAFHPNEILYAIEGSDWDAETSLRLLLHVFQGKTTWSSTGDLVSLFQTLGPSNIMSELLQDKERLKQEMWKLYQYPQGTNPDTPDQQSSSEGPLRQNKRTFILLEVIVEAREAYGFDISHQLDLQTVKRAYRRWLREHPPEQVEGEGIDDFFRMKMLYCALCEFYFKGEGISQTDKVLLDAFIDQKLKEHPPFHIIGRFRVY